MSQQADGYRDPDEVTREYYQSLMDGPRKMPPQKPFRSKQDYQTPPEFIRAVKKRFGITEFDMDLAASPYNAQGRFIGPPEDSLQKSWKFGEGWNWLNPPFSRIKPWVRKAYEEAQTGAKTLVLIPAAVGANWWAKWVDGKAHVLLLNGRITFLPETKPYPKDCCLLVYGLRGVEHIGVPWYEVWKWREDCTRGKS